MNRAFSLALIVILSSMVVTPGILVTEQSSGLEISTHFTTVYLELDRSLSTTLYIKNNLPKPIDALLLVIKPDKWTVEFHLMGYNVSDVFLDSGERKEVELKISPPKDASPGKYNITILAKAGDILSNKITFAIHLLPKSEVPPLEVSVPYPTLAGEPGSTLDYRFDIKNNMEREIVLGFDVNAPEGWSVVFKPSTYENRVISSITLRPGEKAIGLVMSVRIPDNAKPGDYRINFSISAEGYVKEASVVAKVTGIRKYTLRTADGLLSFEIQAGEEKNVTLLIVNEGTENINNIKFWSTPPSGWKVKIEPEKVNVLEAGGTKAITLSIRPPSNTLAGDYSLDITADSEDAGIQSLKLRITVTKQTYWGLIGVLVIVVSITALLLIFWRFGRP